MSSAVLTQMKANVSHGVSSLPMCRWPASEQRKRFLPASRTIQRTRSNPCWTGPTAASCPKERRDSSPHILLVSTASGQDFANRLCVCVQTRQISLCVCVCASTDSNPLDHQVLDVSLPEYFPSAKRPRMSLCKSKAAPEESYSRGAEHFSIIVIVSFSSSSSSF